MYGEVPKILGRFLKLRFLKLGGGPLNLGEVPKVEVPCITERSLNFMEVP